MRKITFSLLFMVLSISSSAQGLTGANDFSTPQLPGVKRLEGDGTTLLLISSLCIGTGLAMINIAEKNMPHHKNANAVEVVGIVCVVVALPIGVMGYLLKISPPRQEERSSLEDHLYLNLSCSKEQKAIGLTYRF